MPLTFDKKLFKCNVMDAFDQCDRYHTYYEMCMDIGMSPSTYFSGIRCEGGGVPSTEFTAKIAHALGVSADSLLEGCVKEVRYA